MPHVAPRGTAAGLARSRQQTAAPSWVQTTGSSGLNVKYDVYGIPWTWTGNQRLYHKTIQNKQISTTKKPQNFSTPQNELSESQVRHPQLPPILMINYHQWSSIIHCPNFWNWASLRLLHLCWWEPSHPGSRLHLMGADITADTTNNDALCRAIGPTTTRFAGPCGVQEEYTGSIQNVHDVHECSASIHKLHFWFMSISFLVLRFCTGCHPNPRTTSTHQGPPEAVEHSAPAPALNGAVTPQRGTALRLGFAQVTAKRRPRILPILIYHIYI